MTISRRLVLLALVAASGLAFGEERDPFAGLGFLVGDWIGKGAGKPGEGAGACSFARDLAGKVIVRRSTNEIPARPGEKQSARHEDLMIIYSAGPALAASYFDSEGHAIEYVVSTSPGHAVFESPAAAGRPRFKLEYEQKGKDVALSFSIAPPGKPYQTYLTGMLEPKR